MGSSDTDLSEKTAHLSGYKKRTKFELRWREKYMKCNMCYKWVQQVCCCKLFMYT